MRLSSPLPGLACLSLLAQAGVPVASADDLSTSFRVKAHTEAAIRTQDGDASLARLTVEPRLQMRSAKGWRAELSARLIAGEDETGLGTRATFSGLSRPLELGDNGRLELDRAHLTYEAGSQQITLGKQALAWGILDGLQVTDRFDPVDRTEAVFGEFRPRRLARWGLRWQGEVGGLGFDAAAALDATVSQLPLAGDAFAPAAPRLRAGFAPGASLPPLSVSSRSGSAEDATFGLRLSRSLAGAEASLVMMSGPETEPVFALTQGPAGPGIKLRYPRRSLIGATVDRSDGPRIWRLEFAYSPDQPVNIDAGTTPAIADRPRLLAGLGLDWSAPQDIFLNFQIGIDHVNSGSAALFRPDTDVIATLRLQRAYRNERLWLKSELLGTLSEGDGAFRPWLEWWASDQVKLSAGADLVWGRQKGLFGQYEDQSRIWTRLALSF